MEFIKFSQVTFWTSDSKQFENYFITRFGFNHIHHYEDKDKNVSRNVCKLNDIILVFESPMLEPLQIMTDFLNKHGDGIRDIAFQVNDCNYIYNRAILLGARGIKLVNEDGIIVDGPYQLGYTVYATIQTANSSITHTFIQGDLVYSNPGEPTIDPINLVLPPTHLLHIDHIVTNTDKMETTVEWYTKMLKFKRFWSVDENVIHTNYSALRSTVVSNEEETIKMPINEPAPGLMKSQIEDFLEYNHGAGIQHIALLTNDIIGTVTSLRIRGVEFLDIPEQYYEKLEARLKLNHREIDTDMNKLKELKILLDFDEKGYLLQIFTKPIMSKPTLFLEIIERHNFNGFGAGNFQSLFECIEIEQIKRDNKIKKD